MKAVTPEIAEIPEDLKRVRKIAHAMDDLVEIPGTGIRIGLDGFLGLIPGAGDALSLMVSGYFLFIAARMGAPLAVLSRMAVNVLLDTLIGAIPLLGDLLDFAWKANRKNLELLERHAIDPRQTRKRSAWFVALFVALLVGSLLTILWVIWSLVAAIARALFGT